MCVWSDRHKEPLPTYCSQLEAPRPEGDAPPLHFTSPPPLLPHPLYSPPTKTFLPLVLSLLCRALWQPLERRPFHPKRHLSLLSTWFLLFSQYEGGKDEVEERLWRGGWHVGEKGVVWCGGGDKEREEKQHSVEEYMIWGYISMLQSWHLADAFCAQRLSLKQQEKQKRSSCSCRKLAARPRGHKARE